MFNYSFKGYRVQSGYAFLHFSLTPEGLKSATTAVEEGNNLFFNNVTYQCKVTHSLQAHLLSLKQSYAPDILPSPPVGPTFKTDVSPPRREADDDDYTHSIDYNNFCSVIGYRENDYYSYAINSKTTNSFIEHSHEGLYPSYQALHQVNLFHTGKISNISKDI